MVVGVWFWKPMCTNKCYKMDLLVRKTPCGANLQLGPEQWLLNPGCRFKWHVCVSHAYWSFWREGEGGAFIMRVWYSEPPAMAWLKSKFLRQQTEREAEESCSNFFLLCKKERCNETARFTSWLQCLGALFRPITVGLTYLFIILCCDGFDSALQHEWCLWLCFQGIKVVVWTYAVGQGASKRGYCGLITAEWGMQGSDGRSTTMGYSCLDIFLYYLCRRYTFVYCTFYTQAQWQFCGWPGGRS